MKRTGRELADWAIHEIESKYKDDVCLLVTYNTLNLAEDRNEISPSSYTPRTSRANGLARTFIIDGIGHDLFPISWERWDRFADLKDYNTTVLGDAQILWARTDDDRRRFESLQARLRANLQNPHFVYNRALEVLDTAVEAYQDMLFEEKLYKVREDAGHVCTRLSTAVSYINGRYFRHGQTGQIKMLQEMDEIPAGFTDLYERIVRAKDPNEQKRLCHEMIVATKAFLKKHDKNTIPRLSAPDFSELASWYQELSYTWRRVYHFCDANDPINAYIWCCLLQNEVDELGTEFEIAELDIFGAFDADNLSAFRKRAESVEKAFVAAIEAHGVRIDSYSSVEEFLQKNP